MSTCVPTPVSTAFSTVTGDTITTTTYWLSTSTAPPVVTTHVDPHCQNEAVVLDSTVCAETGTRTRIETLQPASDVVYTIPYETAIPATTHVPINTVYNGCSNNPSDPGGDGNGGGSGTGSGNGSNSGSNNLGSDPNSGNGNGNSNSNPGSNGNNEKPISVPPGHTLVTSSVLVYTTGPPETSTIPSVITLPDGQITTTSVLSIRTPNPSQVYVPTTALIEETAKSGPGSLKGGNNLGVIIGAIIGGFVGLCLMILVLWYVRRRRKTTYGEILHGQERQIEDHEARQQAIERSKDPGRKRESEPKPSPYHYGSLLSGASKIQSSTSTGVTLSQNPFEGGGVGNRATYLLQGSPLLTTVSEMGEFGAGLGDSVAGVGASASVIGGHEKANDPMNPSTSSISGISGTVPTMDSTLTLGSSSGRSSNLYYPRSCGSVDEFVEIDIGGVGTGVVRGSRVISSPPHLSMSFGSWNSNTSGGRSSGASKQRSGMDPGTDPGPGPGHGGHGNEEDVGQRRFLVPRQQQQLHTMENHTALTSVQTEAAREDIRSHFRRNSGSPVSWASPARGTLFIVNHRNSEDL